MENLENIDWQEVRRVREELIRMEFQSNLTPDDLKTVRDAIDVLYRFIHPEIQI